MSKLNIVIGADITALKKGFDDAVSIVANGSKGMNEQVGKAAKDIQSRLEALASKRPTQRVVRELQTLAMEARQLGPEFKTMADQFIRAAGEMKDSIGDAAAEVGYFASDTRRLDAIIGGAQGIAAGFGLVQGAMAAAGIESESLQKTMVKLQGTMLVLTSLQEITNLLQTESAFIQGLLAFKTNILNSSIVGTIASLSGLRLALLATGIGAAAVAIGYLVSKYSDAQKEIKQTAKEQEKWGNISTKTAENFKEEFESISKYIAVLNNANASIKDRREALKRIQEIYPDFLKNQSVDKLSIEALSNATKTLSEEILKSAKAKAAYNEIATVSAKIFSEERKQAEDFAYWQKKIDALYASGATSQALQAKQIQDANQAKFEKTIAGYKGEIKQIEGYISANNLSASTVVANNEKIKQSNEAVAQSSTSNIGASMKAFSDVLAIQPKELTINPVKVNMGKMPNVSIPVDVKMNMDSFAGQMKKVQEDISKNFEQLMEQLVIGFAETLGKVIAGEDGAFKDFGKQALAAIADFMKLVGSALITTAIASEAFQKMLFTNPIGAAAAGIALVAGSAVIKSQLEKGPELKAFADGGIVYGPTLGLMGEYPGARSNPEVIAPLNKLKDMITPVNEGGYIASTRISGRDLALVIEKNQTAYNRG